LRYGFVVATSAAIYTAVMMFATAIESKPEESLYCASMMLAVTIGMIFLTRRFGVSMLVIAGLVLALRGVSLIKSRYLGAPLLAPDLFYFGNGDTLDVVAHYPKIWHGVIKKGLAALLILGICWAWEPSFWCNWSRRRRWSAQVLGLLVSIGAFAGMNAPGGPFKRVLAKDAWQSLNPGSPLTSFLLSLQRMQLIIPAPDPAAADRADWVSTQPPVQTSPRPDIVVVLEESTFDPRTLAVCTIPQCGAAMFDADAQTAAYGALRVHTVGGGTWNSEFSLFTGLPQTLFGPGGSYAPYNLAPRVQFSLAKQLKTQGYRTIAVYPMPSNFVNARRAYTWYGFDEFHDSVELGLKWESTDLDIERTFERLYAQARQRTAQPLFFMLLTMRQHGPHTQPYSELSSPFDHPLFPSLDKQLNLNMSNYLARLHMSDAAMERLQRVLFSGHRPAVLAHFGDHQPSFDGLMQNLERTAAANQLGESDRVTYYMLRGNQVALETFDYPVLDIGFLAGLILDVAAVPKGAFFEANTRLRERCHGYYMDCRDAPLLESYLSFLFNQLHVIER